MRIRNALNLKVEQLECRCTPAGSVSAQMVGDVLVLSGDQFDNWVGLRGDPDDTVQVEGFDQTLINGSDLPQRFSHVRGISIQTYNGDDTVVFNSVFQGDIYVDTGEGRDAVGGILFLDGNLEIHTGSNGFDGLEEVILLASISGSVLIDTGEGRDYVDLRVGEIGGDVTINTGQGKDTVVVVPSPGSFRGTIYGDLNVDGGEGVDQFGRLFVDVLGEINILNIEQ
jgi:hypothetical protein